MRAAFSICVLAVSIGRASAAGTQEHVHEMAHDVMPFDMSKTLHVFAMTDQGGVQKVLVRNEADTEQIGLIRRHLRHEADAFRSGDFGDPAHLHGDSMPGLAEMKANAAHIRVTYAELPNGAEMTFAADDLHTITAIHRWFGAQLSEHGADAKAE